MQNEKVNKDVDFKRIDDAIKQGASVNCFQVNGKTIQLETIKNELNNKTTCQTNIKQNLDGP